MKKKVNLFVFSVLMLVLSVGVEKSFAQDDLPWFMEQHGNNGNQSPQGAPLDGGSEILLVLGIGYAAKKLADIRRNRRISR